MGAIAEQFRIPLDALMAAKHIEGFLNRGPYGYAVAIWQLQAIPAPTDTPTMKP